MQTETYQPRYLAYCAAHGKTPGEMRVHDTALFPGGPMCGFILWISQQWRAWKEANNRGTWDVLSEADHDSFDRFISATERGAA